MSDPMEPSAASGLSPAVPLPGSAPGESPVTLPPVQVLGGVAPAQAGTGRRWLPIAIVAAALAVAGALVATALVISGGRGGDSGPAGAPAAPSTTVAAAPSATDDANSATCQAWKVTRPALFAIPPLPDAWDWNTPNIDIYIANRNNAVSKAIDLFEPKISASPDAASTAARKYVEERRKEVQNLKDHTYTSTDATTGRFAEAELDQACGVTPPK